ncbi:hypothetical protein LBMAG33_6990 [Candidatus Levyibacteriota bacterium]|nr:hypothetical protein LBMAG33_6990 [Candidatus Levybacteria bacterium]
MKNQIISSNYLDHENYCPDTRLYRLYRLYRYINLMFYHQITLPYACAYSFTYYRHFSMTGVNQE